MNSKDIYIPFKESMKLKYLVDILMHSEQKIPDTYWVEVVNKENGKTSMILMSREMVDAINPMKSLYPAISLYTLNDLIHRRGYGITAKLGETNSTNLLAELAKGIEEYLSGKVRKRSNSIPEQPRAFTGPGTLVDREGNVVGETTATSGPLSESLTVDPSFDFTNQPGEGASSDRL